MTDRLVRLRTDVGRVWRDNHATNVVIVVLHLALRHLRCWITSVQLSSVQPPSIQSYVCCCISPSNVINFFVGVIEILRLTRRMTFYLSAL